ncbi:MAG TPA: ABC transporter ATP-binding protein, partial [Actinomycetota bacterium]|nr:ABC transporter ATP-binding protein [Actinomycetota bacterium]
MRYHRMMLPQGEPVPIKRATVRRVVRTFSPYRSTVSLVAALILVTSAIGVVNPLLIKVIFDRALFCGPGCPDLSLLYGLVGLMVAMPVVSGVIGIWQSYLSNVVGQRVMQDLRNALYTHLQRMPLRFFTTTRTGEIQSRLSNDVGGIQSVVTDTASSVLANVVIVISTVVAMLILSWQLTLLSLGTMPFFFWLTYRVGKARREVATNTQKSLADLSAITEETLSVSGILLSKAFGRQRYETDRFRRENERLAGLQVRQQMIGRSFFATIQIFFSVTPALVYLVAGLVLAGGGPGITAGTIVAFTTLQSRLFFPIGSMLQMGVEVQSAMALFDRIFEYLDMPPEIEDAPEAVAVPKDGVEGRVRFGDVWFRYEPPVDGNGEGRGGALAPVSPEDGDGRRPRREWTLEGVDLEIEPGTTVALIGHTGSGKTTLASLVPRFYDVTSGRVTVDGVDVRDVKLPSLRREIGIVAQDPFLFSATVRENIAFGAPWATDEDVERVARLAQAHEFVAELPAGYDTLVGERGVTLSGGQRQRVAIARALIMNPRILVLDDATASVDATTEARIRAGLREVMRDRTTIIIAHRLSTI